MSLTEVSSHRRPLRPLLLLSFLVALCTFLALIATPAAGQAVSLGVKGGVTFMTIGGSDLPEAYERRTGLSVGGFALVDFTGPIALQPELMYVQKGATASQGDLTVIRKLDYLELPVLVRVQLPAAGHLSPHAFAGPYGSYNVNSRVEGEAPEGTFSRNPGNSKRYLYGLALGGGMGIDLGAGTLTLDLRYAFDLTNNIKSIRDVSVRNRGFVATTGFIF